MTDAPKTALEIVMERLRKKDAEAGVAEVALTETQRSAIAEARRVHESRVAERRIMHDSALRRLVDPAERLALEDELRRDLERFEAECTRKIQKIREAP